jgi:hypothetical protein
MAGVCDPERHQIAGAKLAVDGEIEECELPTAFGKLRANPDWLL